MVTDPSNRVPRDAGAEQQSLSGCLLQLAWSLGGFAVLTILVVLILRTAPWTLTWLDAALGLTVLGMIAARAAHVRHEERELGRAAAVAALRSYALVLLGTTAVAWAIAQSFHV